MDLIDQIFAYFFVFFLRFAPVYLNPDGETAVHHQFFGRSPVLEREYLQGDESAVAHKSAFPRAGNAGRVELRAPVGSGIRNQVIFNFFVHHCHLERWLEVDVLQNAVFHVQNLQRDVSVYGNSDGFTKYFDDLGSAVWRFCERCSNYC